MKIVLETSRLVLREFLIEDAKDIFELNSDTEVIRYTGDQPFASVEVARLFLQGYNKYAADGYGRWTVLLKEDSSYLGWCGLNYSAVTDETDLGFRFMRRHWNQGFATEAAEGCLHFGLHELRLNRIIGRAMAENKASVRVLEKIGMTFESEFDAHGGKCVKYCLEKT